MAISLPQGFQLQGQEPIDTKLILTYAQMLEKSTGQECKYGMPQYYFCFCQTDDDDDPNKGKLFVFDKSNTFDPVTGKFRLYEDVLDLPRAITSTLNSDKSGQLLDSMFNGDHFQVKQIGSGPDAKKVIDLDIDVISAN